MELRPLKEIRNMQAGIWRMAEEVTNPPKPVNRKREKQRYIWMRLKVISWH